MGLINNFKKNYQAMKVGRFAMGEGIGFKTSSGGGMLSELAKMFQPKFTEPPQRDIKDWLKLFASSPRLDPIHKIAEDVAASDWGIYKKLSDGEKEQIDEHPLIQVFQKPNPLPESTWFSMLYMTEAYLQIAGEAFWVLERSGLNQITEIWMVPPSWVDATPTVDKRYFEVTTADGIRLNIDENDMVYFKEPNLLNPYGRGKGRARAIEDEVETDEYMAKWSKRFFYNDAKPPFVIEAPGASKPDVDRMQESWMQKFAGVKNAHKPAVLPFAGKIHQLGTNAREMDFVQSRKYLRDQANQHFRVPPELMGIIENSNRATIDAADYIFRSSVLINRLTMIEQAIQHQIINRFFESEGIVFCFDNVIPDDKEFELKAANEGLSRGAIMIDEWRQKNGYDPLDGDAGQVFLIPATHYPVKVPGEALEAMKPPEPTLKPEDAIPQAQEEEKPEPAKPPKEGEKRLKAVNWKKGFTEAELSSISSEFDSSLKDLEKKNSKEIHKFLRDQGRKFAKYVEGLDVKDIIEIVETKADEFDEDGDGIADILEQVDGIMDNYDWIDEQAQLHTLMGPQMLEAAQAGNTLANGLFELGVSFSLLRAEMLEHIETVGLQKVVNITNTTMTSLRSTLLEGIKNGEGSAKLAKRIRETSDEYSYRRSFVIARTESHNTMVKGTELTYEEANVPMKQWLTVMDGRERATHHDIHLEKVKWEEKFSNGLTRPGDDSGAAEEVIQCRCQLLPAWE
jgi:HK97 family phage portal protein